MATKAAGHGGAENVYAKVKNDPVLAEKRRKAKEELDEQVKNIVEGNPGRAPAWESQRVMQMDRLCLETGKRCVMWDDEGAGFYLMLNWDWLRNRPATPASPQEAQGPGWWQTVRQLLRPPLLDGSVPEERLADWIDKHTMPIHAKLLERLPALRKDEASGKLVLDDPYWQQLQALPREDASGEGPAAAAPAAAQPAAVEAAA